MDIIKDANILFDLEATCFICISVTHSLNLEIFSLFFLINLSVKSMYEDVLSFCSYCEYLIIHEIHINKEKSY